MHKTEEKEKLNPKGTPEQAKPHRSGVCKLGCEVQKCRFAMRNGFSDNVSGVCDVSCENGLLCVPLIMSLISQELK